MSFFIFLVLAIIIFFVLLIFVFPKLLYFSVLLYHALKKDKFKSKFKKYTLKIMKEVK